MKRFLVLLLALCLTPAVSLAKSLPYSLTPAPAPREECYISDTEFLDDTIHVVIEHIRRDDSDYHVAHVTIADPSQLRTAVVSLKSPDILKTTSHLTKKNWGIVAVNGDFYSLRTTGYIVRQGQLIRSSHQKIRDLLLIDDNGDFHLVQAPTKETTMPVVEKYNIVNTLSFGPALVIDGEVAKIRPDYPFEGRDDGPRTAIGQIDALSYVMVVVDGRIKNSKGVTHAELAQFMCDIGCKQALNLDGGGTSTMVFHDVVINDYCYPNERLVSDIVYFASAIDADTIEP